MTDDLFEGVTTEETQEEAQQEDSRPEITSPEWPNWVMEQFSPDEMFDGNPTVPGLRRIAELVFGQPVFSGPTTVDSSADTLNPIRATVVYTVTFKNGSTYSDVADVWHGNCDDKFAAFASATAATRAEGRALRKALRLRTCAAEELTSKDTAKIMRDTVAVATAKQPTDGEFKEEAVLTDNQTNFIHDLCEDTGIIKELFFEQEYGIKLANGDKITKGVASEAITLLNDYKGKRKEVPVELKG